MLIYTGKDKNTIHTDPVLDRGLKLNPIIFLQTKENKVWNVLRLKYPSAAMYAIFLIFNYKEGARKY